MLETLTKYQTETLIRALGNAENHAASADPHSWVGMCSLVTWSNPDLPSAYYKSNFIGAYIKFWYEDDGRSRFYAYGSRDASITPYDEFLARLVWLDFMLLELYDHLETF